MGKVTATITTSVDGYIAGPNDGPGCGLGEGGEALHYWVFGGPWSYDEEPRGGSAGEDREWLESAMAGLGAVVAGRSTYEAAGHWGGTNPFSAPLFVVTHRPDEQPPGDEFVFVDGLEAAIERARAVAGGKDVNVMGGADVIRQSLAAGLVDELTLVVSPVVLGGGKALFDGFGQRIELENAGVRQSGLATFIDYKVVRS